MPASSYSRSAFRVAPGALRHLTDQQAVLARGHPKPGPQGGQGQGPQTRILTVTRGPVRRSAFLVIKAPSYPTSQPVAGRSTTRFATMAIAHKAPPAASTGK
jgi:hypothetical protein